MSKIVCPGYMPPESSDREDDLLCANFALIIDNSAQIVNSPSKYFCSPTSCWLSAAYVGGGPLCLGFLLEGYSNGALLQNCPRCQQPAFIFCLGGSPLSGANFSTVFCRSCDEMTKIKHASGFVDRLCFILRLRKEKTSAWSEIAGKELSLRQLVDDLRGYECG